jgi:hypothetical protein
MATYNKKIQHTIMNNIKIKNYEDVYFQYMIADYYLMKFIDRRNTYENYIQNQYGGGKVKKIKYNFNGDTFILFEEETKNGFDISIHVHDDITDPTMCLHIIIDKSMKSAYIHNITYNKNCVSTGLNYPGGGKILLKMCIEFLTLNKQKYNIKQLELMDNSVFSCKPIKQNINFSMMTILLSGDTWYGKYGFQPFDNFDDGNSDKETKKLMKLYGNNKKIITTAKVRNTRLLRYLYSTLDDDEKKENMVVIKEYFDRNKDLTINKFFAKFLTDFNESCPVFAKFYSDYFDSLGLYNFRGKSFRLYI